MTPIGHNGYSFDDVVMENLERGLLLAQRDCAARALQDPRLGQRHRVVLAQLILMMNQESGMAYPGRRYLAEITGYSESGIAKTISELVDWGYVVSSRRAPEPGRRPLAHYSIIKPTVEDLQQAIASHIEALRRPNVTSSSNVTWAPKFTPVGNVTPVPNVTPVGNVSNATQEITKQNQYCSSNVTPVGNVTPVEPTVTSISSLLTETPVSISAPAKKSPHAKRLAKGTRIDPDWVLPKQWGEWALREFEVSPDQIRAEAKKFHNHFKSVPGQKGIKLDWHATWQNWCSSDFQGWKRRSAHVPDDLDLLSGEAEESEHDRQLALLRRARLQDGLN